MGFSRQAPSQEQISRRWLVLRKLLHVPRVHRPRHFVIPAPTLGHVHGSGRLYPVAGPNPPVPLFSDIPSLASSPFPLELKAGKQSPKNALRLLPFPNLAPKTAEAG